MFYCVVEMLHLNLSFKFFFSSIIKLIYNNSIYKIYKKYIDLKIYTLKNI